MYLRRTTIVGIYFNRTTKGRTYFSRTTRVYLIIIRMDRIGRCFSRTGGIRWLGTMNSTR